MVIEYQIERIDLAKAYFYNLQHSSRTRLVIFGAVILLTGCILLNQYLLHRGNLAVNDYFLAIGFGILAIFLAPLLSMVLAKTDKRVLSINPNGIETRIGSREGKVSWTAIDSINVTDKLILITGKSANVFTIPQRAFINEEQRNSFIRLIKEYHNEASTVKGR